MSFASFSFVVFFLVIVAGNYLLPKRWRWVWLLLGSYAFYAFADMRYVLVLLLCTASSFLFAQQIERFADRKKKRVWLWWGLLFNLGALFVFKYLGFFCESLNGLLTAVGLRWQFRGMELLYPLGISFYVFQVVGYLLDVFYGRVKAEKHAGYYALFVAFFPQLLIGPIERFKRIAPQLRNPQPVAYQTVVDNLVRIGWGLFKKVVVADRLAVMADSVFAAPFQFSSPQMLAGVLAFSFSIYLDFSAYSDIAVAAAKILGIDLIENFDHPLFAVSVIDFWRRWHISLSQWLRDYIFLPLNMKFRRRKPRALWSVVSILITFLVSGVWHGANWTFIVWGLLHGVYQSIEVLSEKLRARAAEALRINRSTFAHRLAQIAGTFFLVSFAWIFFKASSLGNAAAVISSIVRFETISAHGAWVFDSGALGLTTPNVHVMLGGLVIVLAVEVLQMRCDLLAFLNRLPCWLRWVVYYGLLFSILIFWLQTETGTEDFVYFQF